MNGLVALGAITSGEAIGDIVSRYIYWYNLRSSFSECANSRGLTGRAGGFIRSGMSDFQFNSIGSTPLIPFQLLGTNTFTPLVRSNCRTFVWAKKLWVDMSVEERVILFQRVFVRHLHIVQLPTRERRR